MDYARIYDQFIEDRLQKVPSKKSVSGMERHHIIPVCRGGTGVKANLVNLTYQDHMFVHLLLAQIYGGKLAIAFSRMLLTERYCGRHTRLPHKKIMMESRYARGSSTRGKPQHPNLAASIKEANFRRRGKGMHPNLYEALKPYWTARIGIKAHPSVIAAASRSGSKRSEAQLRHNRELGEAKRSNPHPNSIAAIIQAGKALRGKPWPDARRAAQDAKALKQKGEQL